MAIGRGFFLACVAAVSVLAACAPERQRLDSVAAHQAAGVSPFISASVSSDGRQGPIISWSAPDVKSVAIYARSSAEAEARRQLLGSGGPQGQFTPSSLPDAPRWYFELVPDRGEPLIIAERSLRLSGAPNFRDVGGMRTVDGRWVRVGRLYRSDDLSALTEADVEKLNGIGLRLVCDLRTAKERTAAPDRVPQGADVLFADVLAGADLAATFRSGTLRQPADAVAQLTALYRQFVTEPAALQAYRAMFTRLADRAFLPAMFHCTAGKDRTGWAAAVLLRFLGVDEEMVIADYLASNDYLAPKLKPMLARIDDPRTKQVAQSLMLNRPEYIRAALDEVQARYGSMEAYMIRGLGLEPATLAALRANFLAPRTECGPSHDASCREARHH